jgi:hypothetical protein
LGATLFGICGTVIYSRSFEVLVLFSLSAAVIVSGQKADVVNHKDGGTHIMGSHSAFQKQPAHQFSFDYFKNSGVGVTARGSWKSLSDIEEDRLAYVQNTYITCTKSDMTCIEAIAQQDGSGSGYPRADLQFYTITQWTDKSLEAQDDSAICLKNILTIEFSTGRVIITEVLRQDREEAVKGCAFFGVKKGNTFQLW